MAVADPPDAAAAADSQRKSISCERTFRPCAHAVRHFLIRSVGRSELSGTLGWLFAAAFRKALHSLADSVAQGLLKATLDEIARELEDEMRTAVSSSNVKERSIGQSGLKAK